MANFDMKLNWALWKTVIILFSTTGSLEITLNDCFEAEPSSMSFEEGDQIYLPCKLKRVFPNTLEWYQGTLAVSTSAGRYRMLGNQSEGDYSLTITNASPSDAGWWWCSASPLYTFDWCTSKSAVLIFTVPATLSPGVIAAIVLSCLGVATILIVAAIFGYRRAKSRKQ